MMAEIKTQGSNQDKMPIWQIIKSALWALIGVQKESNAKKDFSQGQAWPFVVVGIVITLLFILMLLGLVHWAVTNLAS